MSYTPSPPPSEEKPVLNFEEFLAIAIAFSTLGIILFWGLTRPGNSLLSRFSPSLHSVTSSSASGEGGLQPEEGVSEAGGENFTERDFRPNRGAPMVPLRPAPSPTLDSRQETRARPQPIRPLTVNPSSSQPPIAPPEGAETTSVTVPPIPPPSPEPVPDLPIEGIVSPATQPPIAFTDVPSTYWAKAFLDNLSARGLLKGFPDGSYQPDQPMTRAEFAAQISALFEPIQPPAPNIAFSDVSPDYWAYDSIQKAVVMGFLEGYPEQTFEPDQVVTRAQAIAAIASGLNLSQSQAANPLDRYTDRAAIPAWATDSVAAATAAGIVVSHPDVSRLNPEQATTRASAAAMLHQALAYVGAVDAVPSDYIIEQPQ